MIPTTSRRRPPRARKRLGVRRKRRKVFNRLLEHRLIRRVSFEEYRDKVRDVYDGPQGAMLAACSMLSLHAPLGERLFQKRTFDLRGVRNILDVGSGAGQIARHLVKYADPGTELTCVDLSHEMLRRARNRLPGGQISGRRLRGRQPRFTVADLTQLPFADASFDAVTCGYVLEHLPDAKLGLAELGRVMMPGARMLLLTTEDNFSGAMCSRVWCCRTYNRRELARICEELGLQWRKELWFTRMHKVLRFGGICVEVVKE